jgi:hypothetical protein
MRALLAAGRGEGRDPGLLIMSPELSSKPESTRESSFPVLTGSGCFKPKEEYPSQAEHFNN